MKRIKTIFLAFFLMAACAGLTPNPASPAGTLEPTPKPAPDSPSRFIQRPVLCPTQNDQARTLYNKAVALVQGGNIDEAIQAYLASIDADPNYCDAMDNVGQLFRRQGKLDEAVYWYKRSLTVLPDNPVARLNLAVAYRLQGKIDEAISEYQVLAKSDPENPEPYYGMGSIYLDTNQLNPAVENLKKAEQIYSNLNSPLVVDARFGLGLAGFKANDYKTAKSYMQQVISTSQDDPRAWYVLGICYLEGDRDLAQAKLHIKKARELGFKVPPQLLQQLGL